MRFSASGFFIFSEDIMNIKSLILTVSLFVLLAFQPSSGVEKTVEASTDSQPKIEAPDAALQKFPTDLRRISLIVDNIDESLKLYRDVLGFQVNYDTEVTMSGVALTAGDPWAKARLVLLSTNDSWVGWIGMLEWLDPKIEAPTPRTRMGIGDALLVFNTEKVDEHCAAVAKLPGINMTAPASNTTYPARAGGKPIVVRTCYLFDRDGYFMELNKVLDRKNYNKN
jgi:catechol 2,3-dioxygenase-like lactoylglutathione lyase family enzyme